MWSVIINGSYTSTILIDDVPSPKLKKNWDEVDKRMAQPNTKTINVLYYALEDNKYMIDLNLLMRIQIKLKNLKLTCLYTSMHYLK